MPYTPPAAQSPAASKPNSPGLSRSQSYTKNPQQDSTVPTRPSHIVLPHSTSSRDYLNKYRRSPSITKSPTFDTGLSTPEATPEDTRSSDSDEQSLLVASGKARKSPSIRPDASTEPSPPVSPPSSSDEERSTRRGRSRDAAKISELQAAIRIIEQHRAGSPSRQDRVSKNDARMTLGLPESRLNFLSKADMPKSEVLPGLPLSGSARKISHSRSTTDASAFFDFPRNKFDSPVTTASASDEDDLDDDELREKPLLIRKKSGELVRPALRGSSTKRRPSSMPGTPTYAKAVHFQDNSLEHVRHFLQVDRPIAVSAGSSPVESMYEDDSEYPFGDDSSSRFPPYNWQIRLTNFPRETPERVALPVRTERVYLSPCTRILKGDVIVRNLAFHKLVVVRFTLDYWKTTSEVVAEYNHDVRRPQTSNGCDRFTFNIKLGDQANLESKTMFFCVRYSVNGQEYWDNNNSINYQVDFSKKMKPQNGKKDARDNASKPLDGLPRSKPSSSFQPRPRSMPSFDDFTGMASPYQFSSVPQPSAVVGDSPIRFKNKPAAKDIIPDAPGRPKSSANQQAFGNRYDFGASLSAAMQATTLSPKEGYKDASDKQQSLRSNTSDKAAVLDVQPSPGAGGTVKNSQVSQSKVADPPKPAALTTEKPSLQSSSYHELLDKYCFVRSRPSKEAQKTVG